ncbi:MAG: alpha/beta hydrolase, partial [Vicinamibacterales bacterium]
MIPHSSRVIAIVAGLALAHATPVEAQPPAAAGASQFIIAFQSNQVGTEQISVEQTDGGWTIVGSGQIGPPIEVISRRVALHYDASWRPLDLEIDATVAGQPTLVRTQISGTSAVSTIETSGSSREATHTIDPSAILLPGATIAPYEAVAARLRTASEGDTLAVYVAPQGSMTMTVGASTTETIQTVARTIQARRTPLTVHRPNAPSYAAEVWGDESGRLLRLSVPVQSLEVVREDIASVSARRVAVTREGDENVLIPANGFQLAGTISKPAKPAAGRLPAVILVSGSGTADRDETIAGVPINGQLAVALADAGFLVLRYDPRGVGQSGGRPESATLEDYAADLRGAVRFMSDRDDVDRRRIAVAGRGDGAIVALLAAAREDRIEAVALLASTGTTGAELNMAQLEHSLSRSAQQDSQKQETIALQKRIQQAVLKGEGWDEIPPHLRQQADTPWFRSF